MAPAGSRPVDVCLQTIYGLKTGVFLSTLLHMPYPNRGVVWRSVQSVLRAYYPIYCLFFYPPRGYVHLFVDYQPITAMWTVLPPRGDANRITRPP